MLVEHLQVFDFLSKTDVTDGNLELVADADHNTAFCRTVELGDGQVCDLGGLAELARLLDGVLARRAVEDEEH